MAFKRYNHLNVPDSWERYFTKYPQGMSILESLFEWVSQVDSMVDNQNKLNANVEQFRKEIDDFVGRFDERLQTEVINTLNEWQTSGFLDVVISEALQWQLDDYIVTNEQDKVSINEQLHQTVVSLNWFSSGSSGQEDNYQAFIDAFEFLKGKSGVLIVPQGDFLIATNEVIEVPDNIHIIFVGNIHVLPTRTTNLFQIRSKNVQFDGLKVDGAFNGLENYHDNAHVVMIRSAENIVLNNTNVSNVKGDAVYIGRDYETSMDSLPSKNIVVNNTKVHNAKRNGVAIVSGINVKIDGVDITTDDNDVKWFVSAGVDVEPNNPKDLLEDIHINNVRVRANIQGGSVWSLIGSGKTPNVFKDILIENIYIDLYQNKEKTFVWDGGGTANNVVIRNIHLNNTTSQIFNTGNTVVENMSVEDNDKTVLTLNYLNGSFKLDGFRYKTEKTDHARVIHLNKSVSNHILLNNLSIDTPSNIVGLSVFGENTLKGLQIKNSNLTGVLSVERTTDTLIIGNIIHQITQPNVNTRLLNISNLIGGEIKPSFGNTASRPSGVAIGYQYFDTSLNRPVWWTGAEWLRVDNL